MTGQLHFKINLHTSKYIFHTYKINFEVALNHCFKFTHTHNGKPKNFKLMGIKRAVAVPDLGSRFQLNLVLPLKVEYRYVKSVGLKVMVYMLVV